MFIDLLTMNGYGQFVWPAFIFSFVSCLYLFLKIKFELRKQERILLMQFNKPQYRKIRFVKGKESTEEILSIN